ncbi:MlaD family protein [Hydrogenobaculum acidophilum]
MIEGKPKYTLIGLFIIFSISVALATVYFSTSFFKDRDLNSYYILTKYSVSGLSVGSPVKYKGVDVGKVSAIKIAKDQETLEIKISVERNLDLKKDVIASLGIAGITGLSYIDLERENGVKAYYDKNLDSYVIPMKPSELQQISNYIPKILNSANNLITNLNNMISSKNAKKLDLLFAHINDTIKNLNSLITDSKSSLSNTNKVLVAFNDKINELNVKDINDTVAQYKTLAQNLNKETEELDSLLKSLKSNSNTLTTNVYPKINKTLESIQRTSNEMRILIKHIKNHPNSFIIIKHQKPFPLEETK